MKNKKHVGKKSADPVNSVPIKNKSLDILSKQLDIEKKKSEDYLMRLKYLQADFENFEKRVKREHENVVNLSSERVILKFLSVLDEVELAVEEGKKTKNSINIVKGLEMILTNIKKILEQENVVKINALGKPFDPLKHEATSYVKTSKINDNVVVKELRKGYLLNNKVIRASVVVVSQNSSN